MHKDPFFYSSKIERTIYLPKNQQKNMTLIAATKTTLTIKKVTYLTIGIKFTA